MFDEDEAGWKGREEALSRLGHHVFVKVIGLGEEGRQPDSVPKADLKKYILGLSDLPHPGREEFGIRAEDRVK